MPLIHTILIANRGEIAARVIRTCRRLGIRSVAIYSEADEDAPFVNDADLAVPLGGNAPTESYLDMDKVIAAALRTGADAIHPGYGFLSENADFARKCAENGIVFIGPQPEAIAAMGSKSQAKALMESHGVPVVPGSGSLSTSSQYKGQGIQPPNQNSNLNSDSNSNSNSAPSLEEITSHFREVAAKIGYPVLLKAVAGGGGKGMRIVENVDELQAAIVSAKSEAKRAFGDEELLLEKYFPSVRHIEFQIFGDKSGHAIHLLERECTIQRRYQKIMEESPSPALSPELRKKMGTAAVNAALALRYENAGTVEFILDDQGNFYFLEVNTRLQVEHPVTEMITGLDLVEWQIRIAEGEDLPLQQAEVQGHGYAIECRLYAEDPSRNFMPATGTLLDWEFPQVDGLRVDTGVEAFSQVSAWYDPMLAKVIVHAASRAEAMRKMQFVLREMRCAGLVTNRAFLLDLLRDEAVLAGNYNTHFLNGKTFSIPDNQGLRHRCLIAAAMLEWSERREKQTALAGIPSGWRNSFFQPQIVEYEVDGAKHGLRYRAEGMHWEVEVEGECISAKLLYGLDGVLELEMNGLRCKVLLAKDRNGTFWAQTEGYELRLRPVDRFPAPGQARSESGYRSPMPSQVLQVLVQSGQEVKSGTPLLVLSSMKMENTIAAATDGKVQEVLVKAGDNIEADVELLIFEEEAQVQE